MLQHRPRGAGVPGDGLLHSALPAVAPPPPVHAERAAAALPAVVPPPPPVHAERALRPPPCLRRLRHLRPCCLRQRLSHEAAAAALAAAAPLPLLPPVHTEAGAACAGAPTLLAPVPLPLVHAPRRLRRIHHALHRRLLPAPFEERFKRPRQGLSAQFGAHTWRAVALQKKSFFRPWKQVIAVQGWAPPPRFVSGFRWGHQDIIIIQL